MRELAQFVDQIYCINLDSRKDRWQEVVGRFEVLGISENVKRVSAVMDKDPRIGCMHSHVQCVADAQKNKYNNILIFEDDVDFIEQNKPDFQGIIESLEKDRKWDLFYLGGAPMYPASFRSKHVFKSRFFSTHAYIVNKRAFDKIQLAESPIDFWYCFNTVSYGLYPLYAIQGASYSDIRKEELAHIQASFQKRYDKLVQSNRFMRWWNYFDLHYISRFLSK